jgi:hypothetical protein
MAEDRFHYILARSRTRESSILTIATIASSASLVFLALLFQAQVQVETSNKGTSDKLDKYEPWVKFFGIMFALAGIVYREVTKYSIHRNDERWLNRWFDVCYRIDLKDKQGKTIDDPLWYRRGARTREMVLRSLLLIPIIAWWFIIFDTNQLTIGLAILFYFGYAIALSLSERSYLCRRSPENEHSKSP